MTHKATRMHCTLDWLGKAVVALLVLVGVIHIVDRVEHQPPVTCERDQGR